MRTILAPVLVLIIIASFNCVRQKTPVDPGITDDEYQIYSLLLNGDAESTTWWNGLPITFYLEEISSTGKFINYISDGSTDNRHLRMGSAKPIPEKEAKRDSEKIRKSVSEHIDLIHDLQKTLPDYNWNKIMSNFDSVNQHPYPIIADRISFSKPFQLISRVDFKHKILASASDSGKGCLIRFTRAGFDSNRHIALIFYSAGRGEDEVGVKVLMKDNSGWKVIRSAASYW